MTPHEHALTLAQQLIALDSTSDKGIEDGCARLVGEQLSAAGFRVEYLEYGPGHTSVVAELGDGPGPAVCLTGHLDTVPVGKAPWCIDPFSAQILDGRLHGRGACDMKAGVSALVASAISSASLLRETGAVMLLLTAGEELGCRGAAHLVRSGVDLSRVGAILVAEPTGNRPMLGHKGALWLQLLTTGTGAHGSMPELGDNALLKGAYLATRLAHFCPRMPHHPQLGSATVNVGTFHSGVNVNMVPDRAEVGVDIRTVPGMTHPELVAELKQHLQPAEFDLETLLDLPSVWTDARDRWVQSVFAHLEAFHGMPQAQRGVSFFTDSCVLGPSSGGAPVVILGPGDPRMAHQTDEYCEVSQVTDAVTIYQSLLRSWCVATREGIVDPIRVPQ
jgi:succinyl-diaminopimelate desuccinylase